MRGLASIAVIAIHVSMVFPLIDGVNVLSTLNLLLSFVLLQYAVPMFVFISGSVLSIRYSGRFSAATFYRRRLLAVLPPYLLFTFVYMMLPAGLSSYVLAAQIPSIRTFIVDLFAGIGYYHLWFFLLLIQLYLLYPLIAGLYNVGREYGKEYPLLGAMLALQILWDLGTVAGGLDPLVHTVMGRTFLGYIFYFMAGIHVYHNFDRIREALDRISGKKILLASAVIVGTLSLVWSVGFMQSGTFHGISAIYFLFESVADPFYYGVIIVLTFIAAERLAASKNVVARFLKKVGDLSFGIYLIHPLFIALGTWTLGRVFLINWNDWIYYPSIFFFTLALSYLTVLLLSRLPLSELIVGTRAQRARGRE